MINLALRSVFEVGFQQQAWDGTRVLQAAADAKQAAWALSDAARMAIAAQAARVAFRAPDAIAAHFDALTQGWQGRPVMAAAISPWVDPALPPSAALIAAWCAIVEDAAAGRLDAASITARTAALGGFTDPAYQPRCAAAVLAYPGIAAAVQQAPWPERIVLEALAACPMGSLGRQFHDLLVANNFDLEVLDRTALGLAELPKPLDWLNTRILQAHDLWHIIAGYDTTALHEIAISAFQLAQFGHPYSAQFLSVTVGVSAITPVQGFGVLMDVICSAWRHGRETPPLMAIPWEGVWTDGPETIRDRFAVRPYVSPYPANLIEMMQAT